MHTAVGLVGAADTAGTVGAPEEVTPGGTWVAEAMDDIWEAADVVPVVRVDPADPADPASAVEAEDLGVAVLPWAAEDVDQAVVVDRRWVLEAVVEPALVLLAVEAGPVAAAPVAAAPVGVAVAELAAGEEVQAAVVAAVAVAKSTGF
jgi:ribonuclease E